MTEREIKRYLNRPVRFTNPRHYIEGAEYILTGAVFRLGKQGYYYQAELMDKTTKHSLIYCSLEKIEPIEEGWHEHNT